MIYLSMGTIAVVSFEVSACHRRDIHTLTVSSVVLLGILTGVQRNGKPFHWRFALVLRKHNLRTLIDARGIQVTSD